MKFASPQRVSEIAAVLDISFDGEDGQIMGLNELHCVEPGDIVFVDHPKYYKKALESAASAVIIDQRVEDRHGKTLLVCPQPFQAFNQLIRHYFDRAVPSTMISETAVIGARTQIQPNVFIGDDVTIGVDCIIYPGVVIQTGTKIGDGVIIHANTVIGADAFYYQTRDGKRQKFTSCGDVEIANNVEIGGGCTIDRGVTGTTKIGEGTKLDNQVHVGHDSVIGKHCLLAAQVGLAGVVTLEDNVVLWGQVGVAADITIGEGAQVYAQSGVAKSLPGGQTYFGSPAEVASSKLKQLARLRQLTQSQ